MSGTAEGAAKAKASIVERYGKDYFREIGRLGGKNGRTGGFAYDPNLAKEAGKKGGKISKRGPIRRGDYEIYDEYADKVIGIVHTTTPIKAIKIAKSDFADKITCNSVLTATLKK